MPARKTALLNGTATAAADLEIMTPAEVRAMTKLSKSTIRREVLAGRFPAPVAISRSRRGWHRGSVIDWLRHRQAVTPGRPAPAKAGVPARRPRYLALGRGLSTRA